MLQFDGECRVEMSCEREMVSLRSHEGRGVERRGVVKGSGVVKGRGVVKGSGVVKGRGVVRGEES